MNTLQDTSRHVNDMSHTNDAFTDGGTSPPVDAVTSPCHESLSQSHRALIEASAIAPDVAAERGYRSASADDVQRAGFPEWQARSGLIIPIHDVFGTVACHQLRPDEPRIKDKKPLKYETAAGQGMVLDVPPRCHAALGNPRIPLYITEGVRKADSAASRGLCCIDVIGVYGFRGRNAHGGTTMLADWESVALKDRDVVLAFDSDVMTKPGVRGAVQRLGAFLHRRDAHVRYLILPMAEDGEKVGLDDYFATGATVEDMAALIVDVLPGALPGNVRTKKGAIIYDRVAAWLAEQGGICFVGKHKQGIVYRYDDDTGLYREDTHDSLTDTIRIALEASGGTGTHDAGRRASCSLADRSAGPRSAHTGWNPKPRNPCRDGHHTGACLFLAYRCVIPPAVRYSGGKVE